jgi:hypothetical protein
MPCQFCNSSCHTLKDCDSQIALSTFEDVVDLMLIDQFQIHRKIEYLERLSKPLLMFINRKFNLAYSNKSKMQLIFNIVSKHFKEATNDDWIDAIADSDIQCIHNNYTYYYHQNSQLVLPISDSQMLPSNVVNMIEDFYMRQYGIYRHGRVVGDFYGAIIELADMNIQNMINEFEDFENLYDEEPVQGQFEFDMFDNQFAVDFVERPNMERVIHQPILRVEKLTFHIEVDNLQDEKECYLCCEVKQHAKLGCNHEMCVDCLFEIANTRKKSKPVIMCPYCRTDIDIVYVGDDLNRNKLANKIDSIN